MNREQIFSYLEERFGLDGNLFRDYEFLEGVKGRVFMTTKEASKISNGVKAVIVGLLFCRISEGWKTTESFSSHLVKLSGNITQLFGNKATKNIVRITEQDAKRFIEGIDLDISDTNATDGYVIVKYKDYPLGIGLLKTGVIKNMIPKAKRTKIEL